MRGETVMAKTAYDLLLALLEAAKSHSDGGHRSAPKTPMGESEREGIRATDAEILRRVERGATSGDPPTSAPTSRRVKWEGYISPKSPAYRRASIHDGTAAEVARMRAQAQGSPFFDVPEDEDEPGSTEDAAADASRGQIGEALDAEREKVARQRKR